MRALISWIATISGNVMTIVQEMLNPS